MLYNNKTYSNGDEISNSFAYYFSSVSNQPTTQYYKPDTYNILTIDSNKCNLNLCVVI